MPKPGIGSKSKVDKRGNAGKRTERADGHFPRVIVDSSSCCARGGVQDAVYGGMLMPSSLN